MADADKKIWCVGGTHPNRPWLVESWDTLLAFLNREGWEGKVLEERMGGDIHWSGELRRGPQPGMAALGSTVRQGWRDGRSFTENETGVLKASTKPPAEGKCNAWQKYVLSGGDGRMSIGPDNTLPPELLVAGRYFWQVGLTAEEFELLAETKFCLAVGSRVPESGGGEWDFGVQVRAILGVMVVFKCLKGEEPEVWESRLRSGSQAGRGLESAMKKRKSAVAKHAKAAQGVAPLSFGAGDGQGAVPSADAGDGKDAKADVKDGKGAAPPADAGGGKDGDVGDGKDAQPLADAKGGKGAGAPADAGAQRDPVQAVGQGQGAGRKGPAPGGGPGGQVPGKRPGKVKDVGAPADAGRGGAKRGPGVPADAGQGARRAHPARPKASGKPRAQGRPGGKGSEKTRYIDSRDAGQGYVGMFRESLLYGCCSSSEGPHPQRANNTLLTSVQSGREFQHVAHSEQYDNRKGGVARTRRSRLGAVVGLGLGDVRDTLHEEVLNTHVGFWTAVDEIQDEFTAHERKVVAGFRGQGLGYTVSLWKVAAFQTSDRCTCSGCGRSMATRVASRCGCISYTCSQCKLLSSHVCLGERFTEVYSQAVRRVRATLQAGFGKSRGYVPLLLNQMLLPLHNTGALRSPRHPRNSQHSGVMQCRASDFGRSMRDLESYLGVRKPEEKELRQLRDRPFFLDDAEVVFCERVQDEGMADVTLEVTVTRGNRVVKPLVHTRVRGMSTNFRAGGMVELAHSFPWWSGEFFMVMGDVAHRFFRQEVDKVKSSAIIYPFLTERRAIQRSREIPREVQGARHVDPLGACQGERAELAAELLRPSRRQAAQGRGLAEGRRRSPQPPPPRADSPEVGQPGQNQGLGDEGKQDIPGEEKQDVQGGPVPPKVVSAKGKDEESPVDGVSREDFLEQKRLLEAVSESLKRQEANQKEQLRQAIAASLEQFRKDNARSPSPVSSPNPPPPTPPDNPDSDNSVLSGDSFAERKQEEARREEEAKRRARRAVGKRGSRSRDRRSLSREGGRAKRAARGRLESIEPGEESSVESSDEPHKGRSRSKRRRKGKRKKDKKRRRRASSSSSSSSRSRDRRKKDKRARRGKKKKRKESSTSDSDSSA